MSFHHLLFLYNRTMNTNFRSFIPLLLLATVACGVIIVDDSEENGQLQDVFVTDYTMRDLPISNRFEGPVVLGELENEQIDEASGIAVSRANPGHLWTHNDSGDFNRIFLIGPKGEDVATFRLLDTGNRDWEDMAIGPGPQIGIDYLYIADIGDNRAVHDIKSIFRIPEPKLAEFDTTALLIPVEGAETILFRYPDGMKDAETLMVDPLTRDLYIVSKREFPVTVYLARYPQPIDEVFEVERLGTLPFTDATAGDISPDGLRILIKTKTEVFMWTRTESESVTDAFERQPVRLPYLPEPQGEAIAWNTEGNGYYVLSEARSVIPKIYYYTEVAKAN
jgi:hypothetical protein